MKHIRLWFLVLLFSTLLICTECHRHSHTHSHNHHHHHHHHHNHHHETHHKQEDFFDLKTRWFISIGVSIVISFISFIGAIFLKTQISSNVILFLSSLAVGSMMGDALLHMLPIIVVNQHPYISNEIIIFFGFVFCLISEIFIRIRHDKEMEGVKKKDDDHHRHHHHHHHIKAFGWLNLISDSVHNFTDGIAIVSAFSASTRIGIANSIAIALHEIPQELSDFGLLLKAGFSYSKALIANLVCALVCVLGCLIGIFFGNFLEGSENLMMAFTLGGFLYISAVDTLPSILDDIMKLRNKYFGIILMIIGLFIGFGFMWGIGILEPKIEEFVMSKL